MKSSTKRAIYRLLIILVGMTVTVLALAWFYSTEIVDKSVLIDSPCAAPCWQGIVPGSQTNTEEIVQVLKALPNTKHIQQYSLPQGTEIRWWWKQWPWRNTGSNSVFLTGGVVHDIRLSIDFQLTVEEILSEYGIPEATNAGQAGVPEHPYVQMNLFYPSRGLHFAAKVLPWYEPVLQPTTLIRENLYTVPAESLENWKESSDPGNLRPWPGYGRLKVPGS